MRTPTPTTLGHTGPTPRDLAGRLGRRGSPRTCGYERKTETGGRRLVLVDLDNVTGMTDLHTEQWRSLLGGLRPALGATDRDHLIIAMCRRTLAQAMVALAEVPGQLLAKDGPDGAERDMALLRRGIVTGVPFRRGAASALVEIDGLGTVTVHDAAPGARALESLDVGDAVQLRLTLGRCAPCA